MRAVGCCAMLALLLGADEASTPAVVSPQVQVLQRYELQPTAESLTVYFDSMVPSEERLAELQRLIDELGSENFTVREKAMKTLLRQPAGLQQVLVEATQDTDPEIRWRSRQVLEQTRLEGRSLLFAALSTIREEKLPGLAASLLKSLPLCDEEHLRTALRRALVATAQPADLPFLREGLKHADPQYRIAVLVAIAAIDPTVSVELARELSADPSPLVRVTAARTLAAADQRESLKLLVELLSSDELNVRLEAIRTLRGYTGQSHSFTPYAPAEERTASINTWNAWLANEGATAKLRHPLEEITVDLGRILVTSHGQNKVFEFDTTGKKLWEQATGPQPWACQGLPNGNRLVGSFSERSLVEYDATGKEIWRYAGLPGGPTSCHRLENGNTVIACTEGSQVIEVDMAKKIVWKATLDGRPVDARRLENGRTLVALQNSQRVVEIDESGKVVWEITDLGQPFSAQRLESGNTLVCSLNLPDVREYDRQGKIVWQQGKFTNPYSAQRLDSGNTLVVDATGVSEIDSSGVVIRKMEMGALSRAWRY